MLSFSRQLVSAAVVLALLAVAGYAHFQTLIPTTDIAENQDQRQTALSLIFTHPMEDGPVMAMARPRQFGVLAGGQKTDLMDKLKARQIDDKQAWHCDFQFTEPADYVFYLEPAPYWEPAEQKMIIHYTKVVVDYMQAEEGWDALVGLPVEIQPLVRPYGLWTGNVFRGIVRHQGKPVPFAEIEVEYRNPGRKVKIPAGPYTTQVIKADANGTFCYAMPKAGWWAFAALIDGPEKMKNPQGQPVDVELGAVMWVHTRDMN